MAEGARGFFGDRVMETVKWCEERRDSPLAWGMEVSRHVREVGLELPSVELGEVLVSNLCFRHNTPSLWKFLDHAISTGLVSSIHVLALLSARVIAHRRNQPEAYRLYLELLSQYAFLSTLMGDTSRKKVSKSIDEALQLSHTYGFNMRDFGLASAFFLFSVVVGLTDCTLYDLNLQETSFDTLSNIFDNEEVIDIDIGSNGNCNEERNGHRVQLQRSNTLTTFRALGKLMTNKKALLLLRLIRLNMPDKWAGLLQRFQFFEDRKMLLLSFLETPTVIKLLGDVQRAISFETHSNKRNIVGALVDLGSCSSVSSCNFRNGSAAGWAPFDIYMETAMEAKQLPATSAVDLLADLIITLQVMNRASWQQTFLELWVSALRLVQRERDPLEGPIPHLDARLCMLLCITPLAIFHVLKNEGEMYSSTRVISGLENDAISQVNEIGAALRTNGLICSLQALRQFNSLLSPPASVVTAANNAYRKAISFISSSKNENDTIDGCCHGDNYAKTGGNMFHLIIEACIARKLIDTSTYYWPGYVFYPITSKSDSYMGQGSPWSTFKEGGQLAGPLKNSLIATPAPSLAEIEKLYHIALNGSEEERSAAAAILCGSSLSRGWNIQEHVLQYVIKLLSPPLPCNFAGPGSHLVDHLPMLCAILFGMSSVDVIHIISLHGMVPEVAASLMPLCEVFGSLAPTPCHQPSRGDEMPTYKIFSLAFLLLLRLWKFYRPPHEHCMMEGGRYSGPDLTLEYLLSLHNSRIALHNSASKETLDKTACSLEASLSKAVYIDSFPKLRAWYCQNKACIASTLSGFSHANPVHQVANKILLVICWNMKKGTPASSGHSTNSINTLSGSPGLTGEDACERPMLPAWDVLEATPYVLEAVLSAYAHGQLSSKDLTTGLRGLVDFLPASLGTIISYFSAEITRGIWKPVAMNGIDWPSPAACLPSIESEVREILSAAGVTLSMPPAGAAPLTLPLPVAALVALTITFKLDRSIDYITHVAGAALENFGSSLPWPSMPQMGALWAQKVRRWHDFIVVSCSYSLFKQSQEAVVPLLRSCFNFFLGSHVACPMNTGGINGLLGTTISTHGLRTSIAPGFLFLHSCISVENVNLLNDAIVKLIAESVKESASHWTHANPWHLKSIEESFSSAAARAKEVAVLGASLGCVAGGFQLVQMLYQETVPTWLLSTRDQTVKEICPMHCILEGYAMAYLLILSGSFIWSVGKRPHFRTFSRRANVLKVHLDFVVRAIEGSISLGCNPATWKAYVSCFVGLLVTFVPAWVQDVDKETLQKLANGLRGWHECELALSLLEKGGTATMESLAEMIHSIC
ncbi:hypothetical protein Scep_014723 [Stephania cephalantha]|uniref:Mediator of RNA polymerase II transcription subunit 33A n=1 Tax=Stephania cephalantha TaxID=152367 RepID=A0AAP0J1J8_9MAGN